MQFVNLYLLIIGRKFELLISQGSVATYLRWGGSYGFYSRFHMLFSSAKKL